MKLPALAPPYSTTFTDVHKRHNGNWRHVLSNLGIHDRYLDGKHHPCPGCGGKDRFRFDDKDGCGTWICSQGSGDTVSGDAFDLLVHTGRASNAKDALQAINELNAPSVSRVRASATITCYQYLDADGECALTVTRTDRKDGSKTFSQTTAKGLPPSKDEGFKYIPYRLPELLDKKDDRVLIVEGEKCVDRLCELGFVAICNAGGAGNWQADLAQYLLGRDITILPDNDQAGERHLEKLIQDLADAAATVTVCRLPGLGNKGDVIDWLDAGHSVEDLKAQIDNAEPVDDGLGMTLGDLARRPMIIPDPVHDHIPHGFSLVAGAPKAGKSTFMEWIAHEVGAQKSVLYLALEYNVPMLKSRFGWMDTSVGIKLFAEGDFPTMDQGGAEKLDHVLNQLKPTLTVIDTLTKLKRPGAERGYETETAAMSELKQLFSKYSLSCVCIHHTRKASVHDNADDPFERILGSTALAAVPDNLLVLQNDGDKAVLHTKGRLVAKSIKKFRLANHRFELVEPPSNELRGKADRQADILDLLKKRSATQAEIAAELDIDPGNLSKMCKGLKTSGLIHRDRPGSPWQIVDREPI